MPVAHPSHITHGSLEATHATVPTLTARNASAKAGTTLHPLPTRFSSPTVTTRQMRTAIAVAVDLLLCLRLNPFLSRPENQTPLRHLISLPPRATATMETRSSSLSLLLLILSSAFLLAPGRTTKLVQGQKTWCVSKPSSDDATLAANLNYACSQVDCSILQRGYGCFYPDTLMSHASVAMNLYYQSRGRNFWNCYFRGSGILATTDPSFGSCVYA